MHVKAKSKFSWFFLSQFFFPSTSKRHDAHAEGKKKNYAIISQRGTICRLSLMYTSIEISGGILYLATKIKQIIKLIVGLQKFSL